jgi:hypothetical protein
MSTFKNTSKYFNGGFYGALILIVIMYMLKFIDLAGDPGFVSIYKNSFGSDNGFLTHLLASLLFAVSGGIWGVIFKFVPDPTIWKGTLFGLLPSLWLWVVVVPMMGGEFFNGFATKGILLPILFNCVIWGSFLGWFSTKQRA